MGKYFFDQYSLLHFSVGVVAYFWGFTFITWLILHLFFELMENTKVGLYIINNYISYWPGGKPKSDTLLNIFGDNVFAILGWFCAYYLDNVGYKTGWYLPHIKN